jgi:hypothetical protein
MFVNYKYISQKDASSYGILMIAQNGCLDEWNLYHNNALSYTSRVNDFWTKK